MIHSSNHPNLRKNDGKRGKAPYSPPRILSKEPLEAVAGACPFTGGPGSGKGQGQFGCMIPSS